MKIFLKNYDLSKLNTKIKQIDKYLVNSTTHYEGFSEYGHFYIDNLNTYKLIQNDMNSKTIENYSNNFTIIVDYSKTDKEKTHQIPVDTIILPLINLDYSISTNSKLKFVIQKKAFLNESVMVYGVVVTVT